ncbi:uncharacterized protein LOC142645566 [Dermatophagoides pteronyssinus]|uniref:uncharacterized protein LOC142645566 n=1 Tax=Dermatophagoides pteronyssinus TaxID=6956 RepID=UPI003F66C7F2
MKSINHFKISALLFFFIQSIIVDKIQTEDNKYDKVMIPYKPVYGAPSKCTGMYDSQMTAENYRICQINAIDKWKIEMKHYYTESLNFCCFVYGVLECETKVLSKCDAEYSDRNEKETRRLFDKSCQPIIANNSCGNEANIESKDEGFNKIWIYIGIGIGIFAMIVSIITCRYKQNKQNNLKKASMNAYKTKKFQKIYEMESTRLVYDKEVKDLDKQLVHNVSRQTISSDGSKTFSKKDEGSTLRKWKNNINNFFVNPDKKLKKEIKAKIEADSKNDPTFWDDFYENPEKYYEKPTSVITKTKKFFTRLWPKKEVNNEELMKKEEFIRSEARRQYENIRNNRLKSDKISTGQTTYESMVEEKSTDPLLAEVIKILNQEQDDVYHEMKDIPEPGNIDDAKKYMKLLKDTRKRVRNERNNLEKMLGKVSGIEDQTSGQAKNKLLETKVKKDVQTKDLIDKKQSKKAKVIDEITDTKTVTEKSMDDQINRKSSKSKKPQTIARFVNKQKLETIPEEDETPEIQEFVSSESKKPETKTKDSLVNKKRKNLASLKEPKSSEESQISEFVSSKRKKPKTRPSVLDKPKLETIPEEDETPEIPEFISSESKKPETKPNVLDNIKQSTSQPADDQTPEIPEFVSTEGKKPETIASVVDNIKQSTSQPAEDRTTEFSEFVSSAGKKKQTIASLLNKQKLETIPEEDETPEIPEFVSSKDKKAQTIASAVNKQKLESTPKNDSDSVTEEIPKFISNEKENTKEITSMLKNDQSKTSKTSSKKVFFSLDDEQMKQTPVSSLKLEDQASEISTKESLKKDIEPQMDFEMKMLKKFEQKSIEKENDYKYYLEEMEHTISANDIKIARMENKLNDEDARLNRTLLFISSGGGYQTNQKHMKAINEKILKHMEKRDYVKEEKIKANQMKESIQNERKYLDDAIKERKNLYDYYYNKQNNNKVGENKKEIQTNIMNFAKKKFEKNTVPYYVKEMSFVENKNSPSSFPAQSPETGSLAKRVKKSLNETILSTATQLSPSEPGLPPDFAHGN